MTTELKIIDPIVADEAEAAKALQVEYADVIIVDDESYKTVKASWQVIRNRRLDWQKKVDSAVKSAKAKLQDWKNQADEVTFTLNSTEADLRDKMQQYDDAKKAEKEREERERHERFIAKTNRLFEAGFAYNGVYYVAGTVIVTPHQVEEYGEEEFEAILQKGKDEANQIKAALAEIAKQQQKAEAEAEQPKQEARTPFVLPVPDDEIVLQFDDVPRQPVTEYRDPSFLAGFDACRNMVIDILQHEGKMTRADLVEMIRGLKA